MNAAPHVGFALEIIQADVLARYHEIIGEEVFFNTGTDEHGKKIYEKAVEAGKDPQEYVDEFAKKFDLLKEGLGLSYNNFTRTTDKHHIEAAQELWRRVEKAGYIKKGIYKAKYCVGCELEKQDSELIEGKCPLHPNKELELIEEENYFFLFSKLEDELVELYEKRKDFVIPEHRQKEIKNFVKRGLSDFSISRVKSKMPWGIPVPNDDEQVMYVWFDALTNYISALGWPKQGKFEEYWGEAELPKAIQVAGKDNLRQQSAMWQAMLIAAGIPTTRQIFIHGFITSEGQKMSKSLGNVIDPLDYATKYGVDSLRYYLLSKIHPWEDSDFTKDKFEMAYQGELANGLGNLVARVAGMARGRKFEAQEEKGVIRLEVKEELEQYRFDVAMEKIWERIRLADQYISENEVWRKEGEEKQRLLNHLVEEVRQIGVDLQPFMPKTAELILSCYRGGEIEKINLFKRLG